MLPVAPHPPRPGNLKERFVSHRLTPRQIERNRLMNQVVSAFVAGRVQDARYLESALTVVEGMTDEEFVARRPKVAA
jgi:hypothetical protein